MQRTYRIRVPGPYCPETGHAQTTSRVAFVEVKLVLRCTSVLPSSWIGDGTAGMTLVANHSSPQDVVDCKKTTMSYGGHIF